MNSLCLFDKQHYFIALSILLKYDGRFLQPILSFMAVTKMLIAKLIVALLIPLTICKSKHSYVTDTSYGADNFTYSPSSFLLLLHH